LQDKSLPRIHAKLNLAKACRSSFSRSWDKMVLTRLPSSSLLHDTATNFHRPYRLRDSIKTMHNETVDLMSTVNTVPDAQKFGISRSFPDLTEVDDVGYARHEHETLCVQSSPSKQIHSVCPHATSESSASSKKSPKGRKISRQ
jgi:hypothetical protein